LSQTTGSEASFGAGALVSLMAKNELYRLCENCKRRVLAFLRCRHPSFLLPLVAQAFLFTLLAPICEGSLEGFTLLAPICPPQEGSARGASKGLCS